MQYGIKAFAVIGRGAPTHILDPRRFPKELVPNLKVFLCTGDFGMWGQDRVAMIADAVRNASPGCRWRESQQNYT